MSHTALIVDDSKSARVVLGRLLTSLQIQHESCESAEQCLLYLETNALPDVIFMDHLMPGMTGLQALTELKNAPRTQSIPVVMYTTQEGDAYLQQALALGAFDVLLKPIDKYMLTNLLLRLSDLWEQQEQRNDLQQAHEDLRQQQQHYEQSLLSLTAKVAALEHYISAHQQQWLFKEQFSDELVSLRKGVFKDADSRLRPILNAVHHHSALLSLQSDQSHAWLNQLGQRLEPVIVGPTASRVQVLEQHFELLYARVDELAQQSGPLTRPFLVKGLALGLLLVASLLLYSSLNL